MKSDRITIRLPAELKERLQQEADCKGYQFCHSNETNKLSETYSNSSTTRSIILFSKSLSYIFLY